MIYDLTQNLNDVLKLMPQMHSDFRTLKLLAEAIRLNQQFMNRHPTTLFQCLWNSCWWHDCPALTNHLAHSFSESMFWRISRLWHNWFGWLNIKPVSPKLHTLLENWLIQKEQHTPGFRWLRSLRPPTTSLDGHMNQMPGYGRCMELVDVSPDGTRVVAASDEHWIGVWSGNSGIMLATLFLHIRGVTDVKFAPDGTWFGGLSYYGRAMIAWDTASLKEIRKPEAELSKLLFNNSRRAARYAVQTDDVGAIILNDRGMTIASLPQCGHWCSDLSGRIWAAGHTGAPMIYRLEGDLGSEAFE